MKEHIIHTIEPVYDLKSKVLILGTMPSPKSREAGFYYSHPQNRFWRVIAALFDAPLPVNNEEKRALVLSNHIALWDVLYSCKIKGADDASIEEPVANDISSVLSKCPIEEIYTTGSTATALYKKHCLPKTDRPSIYLPSTSPANCRHHTVETLVESYRVILEHL